jgi:hypothetical protein
MQRIPLAPCSQHRHAFAVLQASDGLLQGLASLEPSALLLRQALELAPVDDLNARSGRIFTFEARVCNYLFGLGYGVLDQDRYLLQLLIEGVAVAGFVREAACASGVVAQIDAP